MLPSSSRPRRVIPFASSTAAMGAAWLLVTASAAVISAHAAPFLDGFEGEREYNRYPVRTLHNWTIIDSVDLKTERSMPPLCHDTGTCIDLVGTTGLTSGGLVSKTSFSAGTYLIDFLLYGSGRDAAGEGIGADGVTSQIQVSFGARSIYANNDIASDFSDFVLLRVYGSGKLKFLVGGDVANIGPLVDNVLVIRLGAIGP
jgi:hypothetical protein